VSLTASKTSKHHKGTPRFRTACPYIASQAAVRNFSPGWNAPRSEGSRWHPCLIHHPALHQETNTQTWSSSTWASPSGGIRAAGSRAGSTYNAPRPRVPQLVGPRPGTSANRECDLWWAQRAPPSPLAFPRPHKLPCAGTKLVSSTAETTQNLSRLVPTRLGDASHGPHTGPRRNVMKHVPYPRNFFSKNLQHFRTVFGRRRSGGCLPACRRPIDVERY